MADPDSAQVYDFVDRAGRPPKIDGQGGGGHDGGMPPDDRFDRIESRLGSVETKVEAIGVTIAHIEQQLEKLDGLKTHMWMGVLTIALTVLAMSIAIQQMTVSTFQGAAEVARASQPKDPPPAPPIIINVPAGPAPQSPKAP